MWYRLGESSFSSQCRPFTRRKASQRYGQLFGFLGGGEPPVPSPAERRRHTGTDLETENLSGHINNTALLCNGPTNFKLS